MRQAISIIISMALVGTVVGVAVICIAGFRGEVLRKPPLEIFADMNRMPKLRPQRPDDFFANGVSSQLPPPGTISRSQPILTADGPVYSFEKSPVNSGKISGSTNFVETNPLPVTGELLARGHDRFDIYCSPHGSPTLSGDLGTSALGAYLPAVSRSGAAAYRGSRELWPEPTRRLQPLRQILADARTSVQAGCIPPAL
jgi:hypothetical protein